MGEKLLPAARGGCIKRRADAVAYSGVLVRFSLPLLPLGMGKGRLGRVEKGGMTKMAVFTFIFLRHGLEQPPGRLKGLGRGRGSPSLSWSTVTAMVYIILVYSTPVSSSLPFVASLILYSFT